jgi:hypothetical protein
MIARRTKANAAPKNWQQDRPWRMVVYHLGEPRIGDEIGQLVSRSR